MTGRGSRRLRNPCSPRGHSGPFGASAWPFRMWKTGRLGPGVCRVEARVVRAWPTVIMHLPTLLLLEAVVISAAVELVPSRFRIGCISTICALALAGILRACRSRVEMGGEEIALFTLTGSQRARKSDIARVGLSNYQGFYSHGGQSTFLSCIQIQTIHGTSIRVPGLFGPTPFMVRFAERLNSELLGVSRYVGKRRGPCLKCSDGCPSCECRRRSWSIRMGGRGCSSR